MKKTYETPTVDKIAFRYRDQVVAASGTLNSGAPDQGNTPSTGEQIIGRILEGLGASICENYECRLVANSWA